MFSICILDKKIHITPSAPKRYCSFVVWCVVVQGTDESVNKMFLLENRVWKNRLWKIIMVKISRDQPGNGLITDRLCHWLWSFWGYFCSTFRREKSFQNGYKSVEIGLRMARSQTGCSTDCDLAGDISVPLLEVENRSEMGWNKSKRPWGCQDHRQALTLTVILLEIY